MPGGVDLHSHAAGPKARGLAAESRRQLGAVGPRGRAHDPLHGDHATAALGYTTVFDARPSAAAACAAGPILEFADLPILDKGMYLLAADEEPVVDALAANDLRTAERLAARGDRPPSRLGGEGGQSRRPAILESMAAGAITTISIRRAATTRPHAAGVPRAAGPRGAGGRPAASAPRAHGQPRPAGQLADDARDVRAPSTASGPTLADVQFYKSYLGGDLDADTFGSGVTPLVEWFNADDELTLDVGQVLFGDTVAMTGDSAAAEHLAHATGVPWMSHDLSLEGGCGVLPITYREKSLVHAWQWAIGLEWSSTATDPWRVVLSTDHPNGARLPRLIRCS